MEAIPRTPRSPQHWIFLFALTLAAGTLMAQQAPTISVNVKVVNVLATVRDQHGNIVNTLTQDDFILDEDGQPQVIRYFTRETDLALSLGLLVDTSRSQSHVLGQEKKASAAFANDVLREGTDSAFLIHFDHEVELLQDLTSSRQKVVSALQLLQEPSYDDRQRGGGYPGGGSGRGSHGGGPGGGTLLYDSIFLASDELMRKQPGRKAIIVLTDGVDHGSKMSLDRAIESAQRADTMVYSVYFEGQEGGDRHSGVSGPWGGGRRRGGGWPGGGGGYPGGGSPQPRPTDRSSADGKKVLERLSRETGGRMFVVSKKEPIDQIYRQIQDELRNQYNLGYTPDRAADSSSEYRHILVTTRRTDLTVQAREGYYASRQIDAKRGQ
ncbi:MAG: VWA domain-containing protein [Acidobacteriia bacterium]|nr:VWA domain-containing protein [Terriglobia bacterium]